MHMIYSRDESAGYMVNWAGRLFIRAIEKRLGHGIGPMPTYFALSGGRSLSQKELATIASVEQPTMANTLGRMERDGLIFRTPDPEDGRSAKVSLTPLGEVQAEQALAAARDVNAMALSGLSAAERRQFFDLLGRVIGALQADG